jgi:tRNA A37 methylthiotransferase MiaB
VASQEGAAILDRAPYVDVVFGPQTLHRLPQLLASRKARRRIWSSSNSRRRSRSMPQRCRRNLSLMVSLRLRAGRAVCGW